MTDIGYVVLARRPNPYTATGWDYEAVSAVLPLEEARDRQQYHEDQVDDPNAPVMDYVIGSVGLWAGKEQQ